MIISRNALVVSISSNPLHYNTAYLTDLLVCHQTKMPWTPAQ